MKKLFSLRIPYSSDRMFGFLLLAVFLVPTIVMPQMFESAIFFSDPLESVKVTAWSILIGCSLLYLKRRTEVTTVYPKMIPVLLLSFIGWTVVSLLFSYDKVNSFMGVTMRMNNSLWFFTIWAAWVWLLGGVTANQFRVLKKMLVITVGVVAFWAVIQSFGFGYYEGLSAEVRTLIPSFLGNPNFTGMFLAGMVPALLWMIVAEQNRWWRLLYVFVEAVVVWGLVISTSRAALLGAIGSVVLLVVLAVWQRRWRMVILTTVVGALLVLTSFLYLSVIRPEVTAGDTGDRSTTERYYVWNNAADFIASHPLVGSGPGNYFIGYRLTQGSELAGTGWFDDPHNLLLYLAVNGGIPLALIFGLIIVWSSWRGIKQSLVQRENMESGMWAIALLGWLVAASFGPVSVPNWLIAGFFIAGVYHSVPQATRNIRSNRATYAAVVVGILLIGMGVLFTLSELLSWHAQMQLRDGKRAESVKYMRWAVRANPLNAAATSNWAIMARLDGQFSQSDTALQHGIRLHPRSAGILQTVFQEYIILWQLSGDSQYRDKALATIQRYTQSNPNYFITYRDMTLAYTALKEYDLALLAARRNVVMASQNYQGWALLARVHQLRGEREGMLAAFRKATQLHSSGIIVRVLQQAEKEPDINKINLPFELPNL